MNYFWLAAGIAVFCNVIANMALKSLLEADAAVLDWRIAVFVGACLGLLAAYALALKGLKVHIVYAVVTCGALVGMTLVSQFVQGIDVPKLHWTGIALISMGLVLLTG